jgi:hypothetical protein
MFKKFRSGLSGWVVGSVVLVHSMGCATTSSTSAVQAGKAKQSKTAMRRERSSRTPSSAPTPIPLTDDQLTRAMSIACHEMLDGQPYDTVLITGCLRKGYVEYTESHWDIVDVFEDLCQLPNDSTQFSTKCFQDALGYPPPNSFITP